MFKDITNKQEIYNGPSVQPLHTITALHSWIKRNILYYNENMNDFAIFLSGSNIIQYNISANTMTLIPLRSDCTYTSLRFAISQTNEKLLLVGERLKPLNHESELPNFKFVVSPRVTYYLIT